MSPLHQPPLRAALDELHAEADRDWLRSARLLPRVLRDVLGGTRVTEAFPRHLMRHCHLSVSRTEGELLYLLARGARARTIVEFGSSVGLSTLYLAAAVRDNGGGVVIGTEVVPEKLEQARRYLARAGLEAFASVREGDARETLRGAPRGIDLLFLDGWKPDYLPVLCLLESKLRHGAWVLADDVRRFRRTLRPYLDYVRAPDSGFVSSTLPVGDGIEVSVLAGLEAESSAPPQRFAPTAEVSVSRAPPRPR